MADNVSVLSGEDADWVREPPAAIYQTDSAKRLRRNGSDKDSDEVGRLYRR
jgi:hypothetical protein